MDEKCFVLIHPFEIIKEALSRWAKNFMPVVAICSVSIFTTRIFQLIKNSMGAATSNVAFLLSSLLFLAGLATLIALNAFICLLAINFLKGDNQTRPSFASAFDDTRLCIGVYLKALFLLLAFVFAGLLVGYLFLLAGFFFSSPPLNAGKMAILVAASTVFVVVVISVAWYGCFFSLAPLIAAFEKKGAVASMRESRARIRGNALRYCFIFILFIAVYLGVGLCSYYLLKQVTHQRFVLSMIDPVMNFLFGPIWLALWFVCYQKLTELKISSRVK